MRHWFRGLKATRLPSATSLRDGLEAQARFRQVRCFRPGWAFLAEEFCLTPQQPAKVAALVGESPTRGIGRFTTERPGACRPQADRKGGRGVSSPGREPMGLNEDEPQLMSSVTKYTRSRRVPGVRMKADVCAADNRQPAQSPAESAWQARREGQPQIKRGGLRR